MEKLIYTHFWGDESCSGTSHIAFEYESKDKFVFDMLEKYKDFHWEEYSQVLIFEDVYVNKYELESLEHNIHALDEWFEKEKIGT